MQTYIQIPGHNATDGSSESGILQHIILRRVGLQGRNDRQRYRRHLRHRFQEDIFRIIEQYDRAGFEPSVGRGKD